MTVEITSVTLDQGMVMFSAVDCSEEHLQKLERTRDDGFVEEMEFLFDTHVEKDYRYLFRWLKRQKAARQAETWGDALRSVCGTITTISGAYRVRE